MDERIVAGTPSFKGYLKRHWVSILVGGLFLCIPLLSMLLVIDTSDSASELPAGDGEVVVAAIPGVLCLAVGLSIWLFPWWKESRIRQTPTKSKSRELP